MASQRRMRGVGVWDQRRWVVVAAAAVDAAVGGREPVLDGDGVGFARVATIAADETASWSGGSEGEGEAGLMVA
jgi:hypothetical protein